MERKYVRLSYIELAWIISRLWRYYLVKEIAEVCRFLVSKLPKGKVLVFDKIEKLTYHLLMPYTYKNNSDHDELIPGVGYFKPGETFQSPVKIDNAKFSQLQDNTQENPEKALVDSPTLPKSDENTPRSAEVATPPAE